MDQKTKKLMTMHKALHPRDGPQKLGKEATNRDNKNYCIVKIGQNIEKSPGDLRKLAVIQTPVEDPQSTLAWKDS